MEKETESASVDQIAAKVDETEAAVRRAVKSWVESHLHDSPFAQATEAWNHFQTKIDGLVAVVVAELKGGSKK